MQLPDWRGELLGRLGAHRRAASSEVTKDWKWNTPVRYGGGIVCSGETYKNAVKLTFAKGALVADPSGLFNASLEGNLRRAIDFQEGSAVDVAALNALVHSAVALNHLPAGG